MKFEKICVIGLGYIGLPTACTFATHGLRVLGVDVNEQIVSTLVQGKIHIHEPGLLDLAGKALASGDLTVQKTPDLADAFVIAVPTPFHDDKSADLSYVEAASESILPYLRSGNLVVLESTSPPCTTTDIVKPILERTGLRAGQDFFLAYSPERVLPGRILQELIENDRVVGGITLASAQAAHDLYTHFVKGQVIITDATTAEMVKLMENTYRDVNIAIANEFARLADRFGVDVWEAIQLANRHPRVNILRPGPGVGGHCISVDPWFFVEAAPDLTHLIRAARDVNDSQPHYVIAIVEKIFTLLTNRRLAVLGLAYKPDVDDLRESPAIEIAKLLSEKGASVAAYEPYKLDGNIPGIRMCATLEAALADAEMIMLLVPHQPFLALSPEYVAQISPARVLVDTVGVVDMSAWEKAGFKVVRLGVGDRLG